MIRFQPHRPNAGENLRKSLSLDPPEAASREETRQAVRRQILSKIEGLRAALDDPHLSTNICGRGQEEAAIRVLEIELRQLDRA